MKAAFRWILFVLVFPVIQTTGQTLIPLEKSRTLYLEASFSPDARGVHTSIKPLVSGSEFTVSRSDSLWAPGARLEGKGKRWIVRKILYEHFLRADTSGFYIAADPLLDLSAGYDLMDQKMLYSNGRGLQLSGGFGHHLSFYSSYLESQARFSSWIGDFVQHYQVVPGMNRVKDFKADAYDFGLATAWVSYNPWRFLNLQLGYGKNFFGDGYRSLMLSDNSYNYPFLKISARFNRFEYVSLFAGYQNLDTDSVLDAPVIWYNGYQKKGATFNYLSIHVTKWMQLGFFEGVIWKSRGLKDPAFNINQWIPVLFLNTIRYSLYDRNNVILGTNVSFRPSRSVQVYGQFVVDDIHFRKPSVWTYQKTKTGWQIGLKYFHVAGLPNLMLQTEFNRVRPYTYGHQDALQSYTHNNQALAHPLGANFSEALLLLNYRYKRFYAGMQYQWASGGGDEGDTHWGSDIFLSDTRAENAYNSVGNHTGQGVQYQLNHAGFRFGYLLNPRYGLSGEIGIAYRNYTSALQNQNNLLLSLGLKTSFMNQYFDW